MGQAPQQNQGQQCPGFGISTLHKARSANQATETAAFGLTLRNGVVVRITLPNKETREPSSFHLLGAQHPLSLDRLHPLRQQVPIHDRRNAFSLL